MYQFSRAIYRELAPYIAEDSKSGSESAHLQVLRSCERSVERLMVDRRYFARPTKTLFSDIRMHFSMADQARVYATIDKHLEIADRYFAELPDHVYNEHGVPRKCQAMTRKSTACARQPLPGSEYCPSHQHLNETFEELHGPAPAPVAA